MTVHVRGRRWNVPDALEEYAQEKVSNALKVMDVRPVDCEVVLRKEENPSNPKPYVCEITLRTKGHHIIRAEESDEDMRTAIDLAAAKAARQCRKFKTKIIDKRKAKVEQAETWAKEDAHPETDRELDRLMDELNADKEDDQVVRTKKIEYTPMTQDEAAVQLDLLGHDFFVYTDRDSGNVHVLYRRDEGGYGVIQPADEAE